MTTDQIKSLFAAAIEEKAVYNKLEGISEDKIYNWRKGRGNEPTIGDMLNVLYQLKLVKIIGIVEIPYEEILNSIKEKPLDSGSISSLNIPWGDNPLFKQANDINDVELFTHTLSFQGETQPEVILDKKGEKKIIKPVSRPNSNSK